MLKNAEKRWQKLERIPVHHEEIFKIENEENIEWANSSIFQNAFWKKKTLFI